MRVVQRFLRWRANRGVVFQNQPENLSLEARIDAAEYELQSIIRDIARVRMSDQKRPAPDISRLRQ
jgi:hypothetical protein